ncbi:MAG: SulP family sulfate permease [Bacteroidetes bacterium]|nr:SulP family sulfate permease [Bacteroidota bacterium]MBM2845591.1 SulP family sulfate permease [Bacteroidota bacterium]
MRQRLEPKLFSILRKGYSRNDFAADLVAGVIVGIVALPLAIAFAIASGVKPEQGLYTAVIAGLVVSVFGGSRVQIAGPTGAFIVIVYGIVQKFGYDGLAIATIMAGVFLIIMGLARLGTLLKFIPYPLTVGFTSGIALIIFTSQINDILGLHIRNLPSNFFEKWYVYAQSLRSIDVNSLLVGLGSLLVIVFWPRISHRVPGPLVALLLATAVVQIFKIPVETIGSRFGSVPHGLPAPHIPKVTWHMLTGLVSPAITIALLGSIESLLSAVVADGMIRSRHRSNMELIAQGAANILSPIFGGIPATGAIARTATNVKNGGRTPVAGIVHAATLFLIMIFFGHWAALIPFPTLAAILVVVSYNMSEWHSFLKVLRSPKSDIAVLLVTFALTVIIDLSVAIEVGVVLAALLFMKRMSEVSQVNAITRDLQDEREEEELPLPKRVIPEGVEVFEVYGTLFFGAVDQFTESMRFLDSKPAVLILETRNLLAVDATGLRALEELLHQLSQQKTHFIISGIHKQPLFAMQGSGLLDRLGEDNICGSLDEALKRAETLLAQKQPLGQN